MKSVGVDNEHRRWRAEGGGNEQRRAEDDNEECCVGNERRRRQRRAEGNDEQKGMVEVRGKDAKAVAVSQAALTSVPQSFRGIFR